MFLDGMRDYYYYRDPFDDAAIEVPKGPSSVLSERGATGGTISQRSKNPTLERIADAKVSLGTDGTARATVDAGVCDVRLRPHRVFRGGAE